MIGFILGGDGLTRQEYIDIVRLHLFQTYLAELKKIKDISGSWIFKGNA